MAASWAPNTEAGEISSLLTPKAPPPWTSGGLHRAHRGAAVGRPRPRQRQGDEAGGDGEPPERARGRAVTRPGPRPRW